MFASKRQRLRTKTRHIHRDRIFEVHEARVGHDVAHRGCLTSPFDHRLLASKQGLELGQVLIKLGDRHWFVAHNTHCGVAGTDAAKRASGRNLIDRGHRRCCHRRWPCGGDRHASSNLDRRRAIRCERCGCVRITPDHLTVSEPGVGETQPFCLDDIIDVVDLACHTNSKLHPLILPARQNRQRIVISIGVNNWMSNEVRRGSQRNSMATTWRCVIAASTVNMSASPLPPPAANAG